MSLTQNTRNWFRTAVKHPGAFRELMEILDFVDGPGERFYVSSTTGNAANDGKTMLSPKATVAQALALCTASKGDTIYLMPGHNEGIGNAQLTWNKIGVNIVGLGRGALTARFDFDHANASIDITANGMTVKNIRLQPSVTIVSIGIDINAAVTDTVLEDIEIMPGEDGAGVDEFVLGVDIKAGCDRTAIRRMKCRMHASTTGANAVISLTGASDDITIEDCDLHILGTAAVAPIKGITTLSTNVRISRCLLVADDEPGIELLTGTTGVLQENRIFSNLATIAAAIVADAAARFLNYYVELGGEREVIIGTASVDD